MGPSDLRRIGREVQRICDGVADMIERQQADNEKLRDQMEALQATVDELSSKAGREQRMRRLGGAT